MQKHQLGQENISLPFTYHRKTDESRKELQAVILVPSRELAMQILAEIQKFANGTNIKATTLIGGANIKKQMEKLKEKPQIVVGTVGRIHELIQKKKLKMHQVRTIIVDEADQLVAKEHVNQLNDVIKRTLKDTQILFFSATMTKEAESFGKAVMEKPNMIRIKDDPQKKNIQHWYLACEQRDKVDYLRKLFHANLGKTIVFIKNSEKLEEIAQKLIYHQISVGILTSEAGKAYRKQTLQDFRSGKISLLLTTDLATRGLDIEDIQTVIHFDFPKTASQYLHRSGRTGRMGKKGTVITLVNAKEVSFMKKMARELKINIIPKRLQYGKIIPGNKTTSTKK